MTYARRFVFWTPALTFLAVATIYFARRPDILLNAQFWAEDGKVWFQDAIDYGPLAALLRPHTGYLQSVSRLVLGIASVLPLDYAPLFSNVVGLAFRAMPAAYFASSRFSWVDPRARLLILTYYVLMPNLEEVHANITNTHWYLSLYLGLVAISGRPLSRWAKLHDWVVTIIAGLAGPFILFALPAFSMRAWRLPSERPIFLAAVIMAALSVVVMFLTGMEGRPRGPLGATWILPFQIVATRVIGGFISYPSFYSTSNVTATALAMCVGAFAASGYAIYKGGWRILSIIAIALLMMAATLASPVVSLTEPQWPELITTSSSRYFVLPSIVWFAVIVAVVSYLAKGLPSNFRTAGTAVAVAVLVAALGNRFVMAPLPDMHWQASVLRYSQAPAGDLVTLPIPPNDSWFVHLVAR